MGMKLGITQSIHKGLGLKKSWEAYPVAHVLVAPDAIPLITRYDTIRYATLRYAMLCYAMLCYAMLCYAMLCYAMLCYAMLCSAMLCYAMLCYAMLCYAMLCYAMLCSVGIGTITLHSTLQIQAPPSWLEGGKSNCPFSRFTSSIRNLLLTTVYPPKAVPLKVEDPFK
jgi:hypothetical protein